VLTNDLACDLWGIIARRKRDRRFKYIYYKQRCLMRTGERPSLEELSLATGPIEAQCIVLISAYRPFSYRRSEAQLPGQVGIVFNIVLLLPDWIRCIPTVHRNFQKQISTQERIAVFHRWRHLYIITGVRALYHYQQWYNYALKLPLSKNIQKVFFDV